MGQNLSSLSISNCFNYQKKSYQADDLREKKNSKIVAISNKYKDTLDNFIDSSNPEFLNWLKPINKRLYNTNRYEGSLTGFLEKDCLDEDISDKSL